MKDIDIILNHMIEKQNNLKKANLSKKTIIEISHNKCYKALKKIQNIIFDENLKDYERIASIVFILEQIGLK